MAGVRPGAVAGTRLVAEAMPSLLGYCSACGKPSTRPCPVAPCTGGASASGARILSSFCMPAMALEAIAFSDRMVDAELSGRSLFRLLPLAASPRTWSLRCAPPLALSHGFWWAVGAAPPGVPPPGETVKPLHELVGEVGDPLGLQKGVAHAVPQSSALLQEGHVERLKVAALERLESFLKTSGKVIVEEDELLVGVVERPLGFRPRGLLLLGALL
eukprot:scaffold664_cov260-Pinguiococcus_pyrenoidosus.AAC.2